MSKYKKWTEEEKQWLRDNIEGTPLKELHKEFNKRFHSNRSIGSIYGHVAYCGLKNGNIGMNPNSEPWTPEEEDFLRENIAGHSFGELAVMHNKIFKTQRTAYACQNKATKLGLVNGRDTRQKNGEIGLRAAPIGHISRNRHGDLIIKVNNNYIGYGDREKENYMRLDAYNWEKANNRPLKKGEWFHHIDGNRDNCDVSNLRIISKRIQGGLQLDGFMKIKDPELRNLAIDYEELKFAVKDTEVK